MTRNGGFVAAESPDGSRLYYAKAEAPGIWSVPVNGGEERMVHGLPPAGYSDAWDVGRQGLYVLDPEAKPRPAIELFDLAKGKQVMGTAANPGKIYDNVKAAAEFWKGQGKVDAVVNPNDAVDPSFINSL